MTGVTRWRLAGAGLVVLGALAPMGAASWIAARYARLGATRIAQTTAAYLSVVTPPASGSSDYDLYRMLIEARSLSMLAGLAPRFEVYVRTTPLLHATDPSLEDDAFDDLRLRETTEWIGGAAVVPLKDRDGWDVIGAVAVPPEPLPTGIWLLVLGLAGILCLAMGAVAVSTVGQAPGEGSWRLALTAYLLTAGVLGGAAALHAHTAARVASERWLAETRLLILEATQRVPSGGGEPQALIKTLEPLVRAPGGGGGELEPADSAITGVVYEGSGATSRATVVARIGHGHYLSLSAIPWQSTDDGWLVLCVTLGAVGPVLLWILAWALRERARPRRLQETAAAWAFLAPATLHLMVFSFGPMVFALYLAAHRWTPGESVTSFVGLRNVTQILADPLVWRSLRNTLLFTLQVPVTMGLALAAALLLNRRSLIARLARTAMFLPYVSSVVAVALVWQWIYHPDFGVLNAVLARVGIKPVDWLGDPRTALAAVMVISIWVQVGYQMLVFLAGLQAIPRDCLDAATVDGASSWRRFWRVTFPLLRPVTLFVLVTGIIGAVQTFTYVYVLTGGGPLHATDLIVYRIYRSAWEFLQFGAASAQAVLLFLALFGLTWIQLRLLGKRIEYV